jgi:hypothetical protein
MGNRFLFYVLAVLLFSCQAAKQEMASNPRPTATSQQISSSATKDAFRYVDSDERDPIRDKALAAKNIKTSLEQMMTKKPEFREVIQKILRQSEKFDTLAEACSAKNSSGKIYRTGIQFANVFKVSDEKYILYLGCYTGAYQPGGVYFLSSITTGIQTKPLRLTKLVGIETGNPKEVPMSDGDDQLIAGYNNFDNHKKELSLLQRCDGQWSCFGQSKYMFLEDQLILQEYMVGSRDRNPKDLRYTTFHFVRDQLDWISSGVMKCKAPKLETCTKETSL